MKTARNARRRDRGVAIEMALSMMVMVFAMCTLLLTFALSSRSENKRLNNAFAQSAELDQIGEDFLYKVRQTGFNADGYAITSETYAATVTASATDGNESENNAYTLTVTRTGGSAAVLTVTVQKQDDNTWKVTEWTQFAVSEKDE